MQNPESKSTVAVLVYDEPYGAGGAGGGGVATKPDWRPIDTAPHGVEVLLWFPGTQWSSGKVEVGMAVWGWRNEVANNISRHGYATHWMPLPEPPKWSDPSNE